VGSWSKTADVPWPGRSLSEQIVARHEQIVGMALNIGLQCTSLPGMSARPDSAAPCRLDRARHLRPGPLLWHAPTSCILTQNCSVVCPDLGAGSAPR
jgi:hypothetical protein